MSEQELRGKIVKILEEYKEWFIEEDYKRDIAKIDYKGIADVLIENGIGDVSELKKHRVQIMKDGTIQQLYSGEEVEQIVKERDEYKHRTEVAEKALQTADELGELCGKKEDYIQQAEKQLEGGGEEKMIKTFIFVEDGSVDIDELKNSVGDDTLITTYRQGGHPPSIQQPRDAVSQYKDKSFEETKIVLNEVLGWYKMSKKLRKKLDELFGKYYV